MHGGFSKAFLSLSHSVRQTLMFSMFVAKRIILKEWKATTTHCFSSQGHILKGSIATQVGFCEIFESMWGSIIRHLNSPES